MHSLISALGLESAAHIAVVGAGGKTTLCWRLVQETAARGERAIFTTTTRIWQPAPGAFDMLHIGPLPAVLATSDAWTTACLATAVEGAASAVPVSGATMPVVQTKLVGLSPDAICALDHRNARVIVEADGARGLRLKAPGATEPVIPPCADAVCVLACLDAIGRPLDDRIVHRVDRVARLTRAMPGSIITAGLIVDLLTHPEGGLKGIPLGARRIAVLTQFSDAALHPNAREVAATLVARGYERAVIVAPRAQHPVLDVTMSDNTAP